MPRPEQPVTERRGSHASVPVTNAKRQPDIAIVGGGICGLTTAIALERRGLSPTVYEAASSYRPVGAGILLQTNALLVFDHLGIAESIRAAGAALDDVRILGDDGRVLQRFDLDGVERDQFDYGYTAIHRGELQRVLLDELDTEVRTGRECVGMDSTDSPTVRFEDGTCIDPDLVIGADGIDSTVREAIAPNVDVRSVGTTVYRAVVPRDFPAHRGARGVEVWGQGTYTGGAPIDSDRCYWFATAPQQSADWSADAEAFPDLLRAQYGDFPDPIPTLVESVDPESVISTELEDVPALDQWFEGSVVLAGDAVHGMLPFAGQGAAQGVEDAVSLAAALDRYDDHEAAFEAYEQERKRRADHIRAEAHWLGRAGAVESARICGVRNRLMKLLPDRLFHRLRLRRVAGTPLPDGTLRP